MKVAINGFGRIGRLVFRILLNNKEFELVAINDLTDTKTLAHLLKHDSVFRELPNKVEHNEEHIIIDDKWIKVLKNEYFQGFSQVAICILAIIWVLSSNGRIFTRIMTVFSVWLIIMR